MYRKLWFLQSEIDYHDMKRKMCGVLTLKCGKAAVLKNTKLFTWKFNLFWNVGPDVICNLQ